MDTTSPLPPADDQPSYRPPPIGPRRLTRSTDDRMIAGVCGGVADYLGVDPTIVRLAAIVLACFGVGLVAYLVGWALVPEAAAGSSGQSSSSPDWLLPASLLVVLAMFGFFGIFDGDFDPPGVAFVLLAIGAVLVWGGRRNDPSGNGPSVSPPSAPLPPPPPPTGGGAPFTDDTLELGTTSSLPPPPPPPTTAPPVSPPPAAARRRGRFPWRALAVATGGMFIAAGAFCAAILFADEIAPTVVLGATLAALGSVIAAGAWLGGTRALVPGALVVLCGLATVAIIDVPLDGGFADRVIVPETVADIPTEERLTAGQLTLDLADLELLGEEAYLKASVAAGELVVLLPPGVTVEVHADVSVGELDVLGRERSGVGSEIDQVIDGVGPGRIELDLQVGAGRIEVSRG